MDESVQIFPDYAGPIILFHIKATLFFHLFLWMFSSEAMHLVLKRFSNLSLYTVLQSLWRRESYGFKRAAAHAVLKNPKDVQNCS